jgi:hypothetical protein
MRILLAPSLTVLIAALACGLSFAQTAPQASPASSATTSESPANAAAANQTQATAATKLAAGVVIPVQLVKTLDAKKAKPGDEVVARVTQDLKTNTGEIVVPKGTEFVGHVTAAQARSKDQKESQVSISFDHAVMKSGDMQLPLSIQAVIAPQNDTQSGGSNDQSEPATGGATAVSPMGGGARSNSAAAQPQNAPNPASSDANTGNSRPHITGSTQGVIGISNLKLETAAQASVLTSDKNNVKLDGGTLLLLKVTQ